jgi:hypothetical protein
VLTVALRPLMMHVLVPPSLLLALLLALSLMESVLMLDSCSGAVVPDCDYLAFLIRWTNGFETTAPCKKRSKLCLSPASGHSRCLPGARASQSCEKVLIGAECS